MNGRSGAIARESATLSGRWGPAALIVTITLVAYLPALSGGFIWDDDAYVTNNPVLTKPDGLWRIWFDPTATIQYYPLVFTSFWIEHALWGFKPLGYHLVNVALHALNAVLLWRLLKRLQVPGAWLAACLFAVHPVHVESVAWVTERKNVLSLAFALASSLAYLRFAGIEDSPLPGRPTPWGAYVASLMMFAGALLAKTAILGLPILLALVIWWKRPDQMRRHVVSLAAFVPLAVLSAAMTAYVEKHHVGAAEMDWSLTLLQRGLLAGRSIGFYLGKLFWPVNLAFVYQRDEIDSHTWSAYLYPMALLCLAGLLWLARQRIGRGPLVALLFFVVMLAPALGFVPFYFMTYSFVADHFQYVASIGPIILIAAFLMPATAISGAPGQRLSATAVRRVVAGILILCLAVLTWRRSGVFESQETLWKDVLAKSPSAARQAHDNLAVYCAGLGRLEDAAMHYGASLREKPDQPEVLSNLGGVFYQLGRRQEGVASLRKAIRLCPTHAEAHCNLALMLAEQGAVEQALEHYQAAIAARPGFATAHFNLARLLAARGMTREAEAEYHEALRIDPNDAEARREWEALRQKPLLKQP